MHTAEAAAKAAAEAAAAPAAGPAAPGTFWQFFQKCSGPSSSGPSSFFRKIRAVTHGSHVASRGLRRLPGTFWKLQVTTIF